MERYQGVMSWDVKYCVDIFSFAMKRWYVEISNIYWWDSQGDNKFGTTDLVSAFKAGQIPWTELNRIQPDGSC